MHLSNFRFLVEYNIEYFLLAYESLTQSYTASDEFSNESSHHRKQKGMNYKMTIFTLFIALLFHIIVKSLFGRNSLLIYAVLGFVGYRYCYSRGKNYSKNVQEALKVSIT
jgi:xanthine/uracil permease